MKVKVQTHGKASGQYARVGENAESSGNESPSDTGGTDEEDTPLPPKTDVAVKTAQVAAAVISEAAKGGVVDASASDAASREFLDVDSSTDNTDSNDDEMMVVELGSADSDETLDAVRREIVRQELREDTRPEADAVTMKHDCWSSFVFFFFGSNTAKILTFWFVSFFVFGICEIAAAQAANSLAMLGDAVLMLLDALTYLGNLYANYSALRMGNDSGSKVEFMAAAFSLLTILGVEVYVIYDAVVRIMCHVDQCTGDPEVSGAIMIILMVINAIFDVLGVAMLCWQKSWCCFRPPGAPRVRLDIWTDVNLLSALVHLVSDCMRTVAVLVAGVIILILQTAGDFTDAVTSLVVSLLILLGCCFLVREMYHMARGIKKGGAGHGHS